MLSTLVVVYGASTMCGIFGYSGNKSAKECIHDGLKRLEYRGYDSWGIAVVDEKRIITDKHTGAIADTRVSNRLSKIAHRGIGHTRWATHGGVTTTNAHPHLSTDGTFALAQNGIVENYQALKERLGETGYIFETETDTEVIVRLIEHHLASSKKPHGATTLRQAAIKAFRQLEGRNTIIILNAKEPQTMAIKHGSPLCIGLGENEAYISSDALSFVQHTNKAIMLEDHQLFEDLNGQYEFFDLNTNQIFNPKIETLSYQESSIDKEGHPHFMLKEITEQAYTISQAISYETSDLAGLIEAIKHASTTWCMGAGGAFLTADQVAWLLRSMAGVAAVGVRAYEIDSVLPLMQKGDVVLVISQSGETADNLRALESIKQAGIEVRIASVVNMIGSTTTRLSEFSFLSRSGPELCVISTKSGTAQTAFGYLLAASIAGTHHEAKAHLKSVAASLPGYLKATQVDIQATAEFLAGHEHVFLLGKDGNFQVSNIGALNIKEASYIHAESFSAGELKHGVIALIEAGTPVICFVEEDDHKNYMLSSAAEVKARGASVIGIARQNNQLFDFFLPLPPIPKESKASYVANVIPCQRLAYYAALAKGIDPDRPRNLAKAVTVI